MHDDPNPTSTEPQVGTEETKTPPAGNSDPDGGQPAEGDTPTKGAEGASTDDQAGDENDDADGGQDEREKDLPDWARESMTKANSEAARYRTQLRELEEKFKDAKTLADFNAVAEDLSRVQKENHDLLRENVATAHRLPPELAEVLQGTTREELVAHAKKLAKFAPADDAGDRELAGGLNPQEPGATRHNPRELAKKYRRTR